MSVTLEQIQAARERISPAIYHSPCPYSLSLSRLCGCEIYCKLDHLQMTGSFKERGARNKLMLLSESQRKAGVIAASAGNHALGLAYHGQELGIPVTVVMPRWAPLVKVRNCREFGATVLLDADSFDQAQAIARQKAQERGLLFVPGFDDADIIAGQGTCGLEIIEDVPDVDAVIVPVGGGGLLAGVGTAIKALRPRVRVIGVEAENAPTLEVSLRKGEVTGIDARPTLADGLAVARVGRLCFDLIRKVMDQLVMVDEAEIARSVLRLLELEKMAVEGAGAVSLAGAMHPSLDLKGKKVVLLLSGGNIDVTMIAGVIERGLAKEGRLCRVHALIKDRPGGLAGLLNVIAATGANIKEVSHDRNFAPPDVGFVSVTCIMHTRDAQHIAQVHQALRDAGVEIREQ
ncbi:MAG: threonine ammonia-lyase [Phycisphaerales bacterium]|nr:threonine ammonia-lyase [Phycisphaerales bacterium]